MLKKYVLFFLILFSLNQVTIAQIIPSYVPTNGLNAWWSFTGNANDGSGHNFNGVVNGATLTTDRFGMSNSAYNFVSGNYISLSQSIGASLNTLGIGTINIWFKTANSAGEQLIFKGNYTDAYGEQFSIHLNPTSVNSSNNHFGIKYNSNCSPMTSPWTLCSNTLLLNDDKWHMITVTIDPQYLKYYIDGILKTVTPTPSATYTNCASEISIGRCWSYEPSYFIGKIDDIGIWNRALSQEEITSLFNGAPAGVDLVNASSTIDFFPNPVKNKLNIHTHAKFVASVYRLSDQIGKTLKNGTIQDENTEIDLSMFSSGIYFLSIDNDKKEVFKIIKE
jgi:hypothetical protein